MKLKTKIIALASTALLFVGAAFGITLSQDTAVAEEWNVSSTTEWEWADSYEFGSTIVVPAYKVSANGKEVDATAVVTYPNGDKTTETTIALKQAGIYTVSYFANVDGKEYSKTVTFEVGYKAYYASNLKTELSYGVYTGFGADTETYSNYKHDGLLVRLANGDKLEFSHLIDVTELSPTTPIVTGFITPDEWNSADFNRLVIKLTDSKDPSIYAEIELNRWEMGAGAGTSSGKATSFVSAAGNGQDWVGYEDGKGLHINDGVGTPMETSFVAVAYKNANGSIGAYWSGIEMVQMAPSRFPFSLSYDYASNSVYAGARLVADFDSSDYYNTLWHGFPSGKARLTVYATEYNSFTANFCLTSVYGLDDLSNTSFTENEAPEITVESEYTATTMPNAKIGTAYKIPTATAYDAYSGICKVDTQVWYNYTSNEPVSVSINNGTFTPERNGYYSIVYTAKDNFGQVGSVIYPVYATADIPELTVTLPENVPADALLGYEIKLDAPIMAGGTGNLTYKTTAVTPAGETMEVDGSFIPELAGEWTVTYTATDYIGTIATASFKFDAAAGDKPVINAKALLPKMYMSGISYVLPEIYADNYSSGKKASELCDVKIEYADGKTETKKAGDTFIPTVANSGEKIKVTYYSGAASLETAEIPVLIVKDGSKVFVKNYLYGDNITVVGQDEEGKNYKGLHVYAEKAGDAVWTFANPQVAELVAIKLQSLQSKTKYSALAFTLTDAENPEESVTMTVEVSTASVKLICGSFVLDVATSLMTETTFNVTFAGGKFKFENANVDVDTYDNGEAFNGFSSNKVYITVAMKDAKAGAGYMLLEMGGAATTNNDRDPIAPSFAILGDSGGSYSIGSSYVLAPAIAGDTFAPETSLTVTVLDPNGNPIKDKNGLLLEDVDASESYTISLVKYGLYSIVYRAAEVNWGGRVNEFINYVNVMDEVDPVITVTSNYTMTAKVGELLIFPNISVTDNITASENIIIDKFVQNPTGRLVRLSVASNCVVATYEGTYILSYLVKDEYGNSATIYFEVTVTK